MVEPRYASGPLKAILWALAALGIALLFWWAWFAHELAEMLGL